MSRLRESIQIGYTKVEVSFIHNGEADPFVVRLGLDITRGKTWDFKNGS